MEESALSLDPHKDNGLLDERINIRGYFERILAERDKRDAERDKRLDERFEAQEKAIQFALTEREKAVNAALTAAEKAVDKAEEAGAETMKSHNDLIRQSRDRDATYATKDDLAHLKEQVDDLRGTRREGVGQSADVVARLITILVPAAAFVFAVYLATHH